MIWTAIIDVDGQHYSIVFAGSNCIDKAWEEVYVKLADIMSKGYPDGKVISLTRGRHSPNFATPHPDILDTQSY
tara:strand:+ start:440 stop:661 length:222 start_codon:yes stop_codon:yes gene_type:complete